MPPTRAHIRATLDRYLSRHPEERQLLLPLRESLAVPADPTSRTTHPGHVTCSAILIDPEGRVLHLHHKALDIDVTPGGHIEHHDEDLTAAVLRELEEEAGIPCHAVSPPSGMAGIPLDINIHTIPASLAKGEPEHQHFDFRFPFCVAQDHIVVLQDAEVTGYRWLPASAVTSPSVAAKLTLLALT
jgi:8-oxo-dGTP pyrophosphatase MutT (NUDIX family)